MAWDDVPPTKAELGGADWASEPPRPEELGSGSSVADAGNAVMPGAGTVVDALAQYLKGTPDRMREADRVRSQSLSQIEARGNEDFNRMIGRDSYGPPMPPEQLPEERKFGDAITAGVTMTAGGGGNPVRQGVDMARPIPGKMMASAIKSEGFTPEMGQDLIDMGVRGTRSGMLSQISQKLPEIEQGIQDTVGASPKPVDISGVPDAIANSAKSAPGQGLAYQTRSGITGIGLQPQVNRVAALADEARGLGQTLPSPEALDHLRLLGKLGYGEGEELKTAVGGAARAGRAAMRDSLTAVHPELDPALAKEAALLEAKRGLEDQGVKSFLEDFLKGRLKLGKIIPGSTAVRSYGAAAANAALNAGDVAADAYPALEPFLKNKTLRDTQRD